MAETQGEFRATIDHYHELLHQNPNDLQVLINLAWSYERASNYPEAIQQFRRALEAEPNDADANYGMALALLGNGQNAEALSYFSRTRDLVASEDDRARMVIMSQQIDVYIRRLQSSG